MVNVANSTELNNAIAANEAMIICTTATVYNISAVPTYPCHICLPGGASLTGAFTASNSGPAGSEAYYGFGGAGEPPL